MKDLEDRVITRHRFHGDWNYTLPPVPRPATAAPAPPPPGPDLAALAHPALTGIGDFAALTASVTLAWEAAREQRLHLTRGGRRRRSTGPSGPTRLSLHGHILATIYRQRLAMPCHLIGTLLGVDETSISLATCRVAPILKQQGITITPAGTRISTLSALRDYAAAAGITLPEPPPPPQHTTPESTLQTRDTPQTHLITGRVPADCEVFAIMAAAGRPAARARRPQTSLARCR